VYYETLDHVLDAIAREKQLKGWTRAKKVWLVETENREWKDLSEDWYR
jgi:putative endonuclease